jgi:hypothetical protein
MRDAGSIGKSTAETCMDHKEKKPTSMVSPK